MHACMQPCQAVPPCKQCMDVVGSAPAGARLYLLDPFAFGCSETLGSSFIWETSTIYCVLEQPALAGTAAASRAPAGSQAGVPLLRNDLHNCACIAALQKRDITVGLG